MSTLATAFSHSSTSTAVIVPGQAVLTVSYKQLHAEVSSFQRKLADLGIGTGDAVSIAIPNTYEFVVAFLAASWQRGIAAPLNPAYKQSEFEFYIDDLKSAVALVPRGAYQQDAAAVRAARKYQAAIAECYWNGKEVVLDVKEKGKLASQANKSILRAHSDDVALVLHTSGTTGRPKAVPLTHRNLTQTMKNVQDTYQLTAEDRTMLVMPLFHVHGLLAAFLAPLASGGSIVLPPKFSASTFWNDFTAHKANWYTAVPTIHSILLKSPLPLPLPKIRFIRSCSSPLAPATLHALESALHAPVLEAYAMTEAAHQMTSNPLPPRKSKPGSVGVPQNVDLAVLPLSSSDAPEALPARALGEICIQGPNVTKGYLSNPAANASSFTSNGYFRTGDQGYVDEEGYVFITGRIKELINRGGEKISPVELDHVLSGHEAVAEAVHFAAEDELLGQDVAVAVLLKEGFSSTAEELQAWMKEKVAAFKVPRKVFFVDLMPKTATGKVQRRMVAEAMAKRESKLSKL